MTDMFIEIDSLQKEAVLRERYKNTPMADCGDGVYRRIYDGTELSDFKACVDSLKSELGGAYYERAVCDNYFFGAKRGNGYVYLSYYSCRKRMCLYLADESELIPTQLAEGVHIANEPVLVQFCPTDPLDGPGGTGNFGMCYVFDLGEGHFLVYDGLGDRQNDDERIFASLTGATPEGQKPIIDAWIFTHPHYDHIAGARKLALKHAEELVVRNFVMNMPDTSRYTLKEVGHCADCYNKWLPDIFSCFPDAKIWKAHTGQHFFVGDAEVEILYTHEDHPDGQLVKLNDSSLVTRVYYGGKSFLFPADIETQTASVLLRDMYGAYLKSDFYQTAHHGWEASALEYYYDVDPEYVLFPLRQKHWYSDTFWSFPATVVLREEYDSGKRKFYLTLTEDTVIKLNEL